MSADRVPVRAPKGTNDILPPGSFRWQELVRLAQDSFERAGYAPVETPTFEDTALFERGVGETSEVVTKQMYTFEDLGGRSLTLRPEGTAGVVRAVIEHSLDRGPLPIKLNYASWMFRQERPQKGRYRQFFQVGIEAMGTDHPTIDAEVIQVGDSFLRAAGATPTLLLNSIGHLADDCRTGYNRTLVGFLRDHEDELAPEDVKRIDTNPMRTFDSKEEKTIVVMASAPVITDHLCDACTEHFAQVKGYLDDLGVIYTLEPRLVRGLDYYTRTAFEFVWSGLGSQNAMGGGGRYDGLAEMLGGNPLPGIGFALGVDRILLALNEEHSSRGTREQEGFQGGPKVEVYFVAIGDEAAGEALRLATRLRLSGIGADLDHARRGMKGQMKDAARSGAKYAAILGDEELAAGQVTLRDLTTGEQERISITDLEARVRTG
ncbi:MAG: histidine--tRNA ligase [Actinobacteria bacterium]|nr:histidine--tRNA ligase [Actinomycetota bacterium]